jgi:hypothetical protein
LCNNNNVYSITPKFNYSARKILKSQNLNTQKAQMYAQNLPFRVLTAVSNERKEHEMLSSEKYSLSQTKGKPAPIQCNLYARH